MEDVIKVYRSGKSSFESISNNHKSFVSINEKPIDTIRNVFTEQADKTRWLAHKYPWAQIGCRWLCALLLFTLFIGFIGWSISASIDQMAERRAAVAMADYKAEQDAAEAERLAEIAEAQQSEEAINRLMAEMLAKLFYGIRNFEDKYNYSEADFLTLARCVFNRVENTGNSNLLEAFETTIDKEDQWVGYFGSNPIVDKYYALALKAITDWRSETSKPCSTEYIFTMYTPKGLYLAREYNSSEMYDWWRYGR